MSRICTWVAAGVMSAGLAQGATLPDVMIEDTLVFPESLDASQDGTLYIGSWKGIVYRAPPKQSAQAWVKPSTENGLLSILGVLADDRGGQVWVCSVPAPTRDPPAPGITALMSFDIKTGAQRLNLPFPAPAGGVCNDISLGRDGSAYVSDTPNGRIFKVRRGGKALELFVEDERLKGIDGIAFGGDGMLYANLVTKNTLWRIGMGKDGKAGAITEIMPSQPLDGPDGFRLIRGNRFLIEENRAGRIDEVDISGDKATIKVLKEGLMTPTAGIAYQQTIFAVERKIDYVRKAELKGQDPGPFKVMALPLP